MVVEEAAPKEAAAAAAAAAAATAAASERGAPRACSWERTMSPSSDLRRKRRATPGPKKRPIERTSFGFVPSSSIGSFQSTCAEAARGRGRVRGRVRRQRVFAGNGG